MSSSSLTDEQRQRIEKNKRKAQERLARKRPAPSSDLVPPPQTKKPSASASSSSTDRSTSTAYSSSNSRSSGWSKASNHVTRQRKTAYQRQTATAAVFVLCEQTRFKAIVPYNAQLIELFKGIPTRSYDASTQVWSFGLQDYHNLIELIRQKVSHIRLDLIPKPVLNTFLCHLSGKSKGEGASSDKTTPIEYKDKVGEQLYSTLMEFQKQGIEYCLQRNGRCLLADDMGLGKTLQAIAVVSYYRQEWPLLVVCPSSLKIAWAEAFQRWIPSLSKSDINVVMTTKCSLKGLITIISYDLLSRMSKYVQQPGVIIADESHFLKNYKTARAKAALPLIKKAKRALLLSGTPALSRPIELYTQISSLDKQFSLSLVEYGKRYCSGIQSTFGWDFSGSSNMGELQLYMEHRLMIRRLKVDVLDQLPSKQRQTVILDPSVTKVRSREWKDFHSELDRVSTLDKGIDRKTALLPLFSKTGIMKLPAVKDYIYDQLQGDRKLLVFAHHKQVMNGICQFLTDKKYQYVRIDGSTPPELWQSYCDQFQHDDNCMLAILSITAANTGLTLTAASCVIFAELFWNPGVLVQAEDRVYRIGQQNSVNIYYLVAQDTVDDFIWPMIQKKLKVLTQAGLAIEDFTNTESSSSTHIHKSIPDQQLTLDDWFPPQEKCTTTGSLKSSYYSSTSGSNTAATDDDTGEHEEVTEDEESLTCLS